MSEIAKATSAYNAFKNAAQNDRPRTGNLHQTMTHLHLSEATRALAGADALLITAGAGMGVDSGLPDFRGNEGFWKAYPALGRAKKSFTDMANPADAWAEDHPEGEVLRLVAWKDNSEFHIVN